MASINGVNGGEEKWPKATTNPTESMEKCQIQNEEKRQKSELRDSIRTCVAEIIDYYCRLYQTKYVIFNNFPAVIRLGTQFKIDVFNRLQFLFAFKLSNVYFFFLLSTGFKIVVIMCGHEHTHTHRWRHREKKSTVTLMSLRKKCEI